MQGSERCQNGPCFFYHWQRQLVWTNGITLPVLASVLQKHHILERVEKIRKNRILRGSKGKCSRCARAGRDKRRTGRQSLRSHGRRLRRAEDPRDRGKREPGVPPASPMPRTCVTATARLSGGSPPALMTSLPQCNDKYLICQRIWCCTKEEGRSEDRPSNLRSGVSLRSWPSSECHIPMQSAYPKRSSGRHCRRRD